MQRSKRSNIESELLNWCRKEGIKSSSFQISYPDDFFTALAFFHRRLLELESEERAVMCPGRCCDRPTEGVEVLAVLEPRCQSPRPPSISHNMTFMLNLSFTRIVTQTVEERTERSAERDGERPDLQLHLARAAVCCVWRRI